MDTFGELKQLKYKADRLNKQVDKVFKHISSLCQHQEVAYWGKDPWLRCTNTVYPFVKYSDIIICNKDKCPKLNQPS